MLLLAGILLVPLGVSAAETMTVSAKSGVNVRDKASTEGDVIGGLPYGAEVEIKGKTKGWYKIDYRGETGYIYAEFLTDIDNDLVFVSCADGANLRKKASTESDILICVPAGTILTVEKEKSGWCNVKYSGQDGYIRKDLLSVYNGEYDGIDEAEDTTEKEASAVKKIKKTKMEVNCYDGVNIRSDAGPGYERLGGLSYLDTVTVIGEKDGWYQVKYEGQTGFIYQEWLSKPEESVVPSLKEGSKATVTEELNMRAKASTDSRIIRVLPAGTKVTILSRQGDWYIVEYDGESGACYGEFLK